MAKLLLKVQHMLMQRKILPNAKQKVKIAENMFPIIAETARLLICLALSTKFPTEPNKGEGTGYEFATNSIWVSQKFDEFENPVARNCRIEKTENENPVVAAVDGRVLISRIWV